MYTYCSFLKTPLLFRNSINSQMWHLTEILKFWICTLKLIYTILKNVYKTFLLIYFFVFYHKLFSWAILRLCTPYLPNLWTSILWQTWLWLSRLHLPWWLRLSRHCLSTPNWICPCRICSPRIRSSRIRSCRICPCKLRLSSICKLSRTCCFGSTKGNTISNSLIVDKVSYSKFLVFIR